MADVIPLEIHECGKAEELIRALDPTQKHWGSNPKDWCFRGQDKDLPLVPSALRKGAYGPYTLLGQEDPNPDPQSPLRPEAWWLQAEYDIVRDFFVAADRAGLAIPHDIPALRSHGLHKIVYGSNRFLVDPQTWPPDELLAILALAQHYGAPTRLLDWSYRPLVAAYFACAKVAREFISDEKIVVWALNLMAIRVHIERERVRIVEAPQATNPNLAAQAGLFTLDRLAKREEGFDVILPDLLKQAKGKYKKDGITSAWVNLALALPVFRKFTLPIEEAGRLLRLLGLYGVSAATVFPGYQGVVDSLHEMRRWEE